MGRKQYGLSSNDEGSGRLDMLRAVLDLGAGVDTEPGDGEEGGSYEFKDGCLEGGFRNTLYSAVPPGVTASLFQLPA